MIHRGGQAGFSHTPLPIGGLAVTDGDAHGPGLVSRAGRITLPLEDANHFFYTDPFGLTQDAVACCENYLSLVESFHRALQTGPWT